MAPSDYHRGEMDISSQSATWKGFMLASTWACLIVILLVGYLVFTLTLGMHWLVALSLCAGAGIAAGLFMGLGVAWLATVVAMAALAIVVQVIITVVSLLI